MSLGRAVTALGSICFGLVPSLVGQEAAHVDARPTAAVPILFDGTVSFSDGSPAEGAVVVTSAGGKAVTDPSGGYRLAIRVPAEARSVQITAFGRESGRLVASTSVALAEGSARSHVGPLVLASEGVCQPSWLPTFGGEPGVSGPVLAMTVFDDGGGSALYVAGDFTSAGGVAANGIARFDGSSWTSLGSGVNGPVLALTVFDDGSGPALYAGGYFTTAGGTAAKRIAKWDGSSWSAVGSGIGGQGSRVSALAAFDDGTGPRLYAGGRFPSAGGRSASNIAKWDGASWTPLGGGTDDDVQALTVLDDGSGLALFVGGAFIVAGGTLTNHIAKWDGSRWNSVGDGTDSIVLALAVFDDGGGAALYAGGAFSTAGGVPASRIAKWDGTSWASLGNGLVDAVYALAVFDDGNGPAMCAGGGTSIARWNGATWTALGSGTDDFVIALAAFDDGTESALFAGGTFTIAGGTWASQIAKWDGSSWTALGSGLNDDVFALDAFDDGSGGMLYAGGTFQSVGGMSTSVIARWNGSTWGPVGSGPSSPNSGFAGAFDAFDDGSGPALYAGGTFWNASNVDLITRWNGASWSALGSELSGSNVTALRVFDDGGGPALYAGGDFVDPSHGPPIYYIAKWNGASWSALGDGLSMPVLALTVFDDGNGPALYAGGRFGGTSGITSPLTLNFIGKWDGSSWNALSGGMNNEVYALTVFDDGSGPALFAGGAFTTAGGVPANGIAKWDGASWSALDGGVSGSLAGRNPAVYALAVFDDGGGPALYAGGAFMVAGTVAASGVAKWDGSSWAPLGSGTIDRVRVLTVFNDRTGNALYAGGEFTSAPDSGDSYLAKWGCEDTNPPVITCPPSIRVDDRRGNGRGELLTFTATATDAEDPTPSLVCTPPSGSLFPPGATVVTCTAMDYAGNQSTCQFTVTVASKLHAP